MPVFRFAKMLCIAPAVFVIGMMAPGDAAAQSRRIAVETADGARSALVFHAGAGPKPVVLVLHGGRGSAERMARWSGFAAAAAARGFLAVFPDGARGQWNDGRADFRGSIADDVGFLKALVGQLVAEGLAHPGKVFVAGASNGGMMALRLACEAGVELAGVAPLIANMPASLSGCRPPKPLPILMMNGTADPLVPYAGGGVGLRGGRGAVLSTEQTIAPFAGRNGCADMKERKLPDRDPADGSTVTLLTWTGCDVPTVVYRIDGGGHQLPGAGKLSELLTGKQNRDIDAATTVMDFFARLGG